MKSKYLLKISRRSRRKESIIDRLLNKIMIGTFILFITVVVIMVLYVLWDMIEWYPVQ